MANRRPRVVDSTILDGCLDTWTGVSDHTSLMINLDFLRLELEFILMKLLLPLASSVMLTIVTSKETARLSHKRTQSVTKLANLQNIINTHYSELHLLVTLTHEATCEGKRVWDLGSREVNSHILPPLRRTTSSTFLIPHHNNPTPVTYCPHSFSTITVSNLNLRSAFLFIRRPLLGLR